MEFNLFDFEHSKILENLPFIIIMGALLLFPFVPKAYSIYVMFGGIGIGITLLIGMEQYAKIAAIGNLVMKARIDEWDKEVEFHCFNPEGQDPIQFNPLTKEYTSTWELAIPVKLPLMEGKPEIEVNKIKIKHILPWDTRNHVGKKHWVHWRGIEVQSTNAIMVTLLPPTNSFQMNKDLEIIPVFTLFRANRDVKLRKKYPTITLVPNEVRQ